MKPIPVIISTILIVFISLSQSTNGCPDKDSVSKEMVQNFLTDSNLSNARQETGTTNLDTSQIQVVTDQSTCQTFNNEFSSYKDDYKITYYKVGDFYFVTQILKQPENPDEVVTGLSFIYIYDENLNFIKGYSG